MDDIGRYDYQTILYGYGNTTKIDYVTNDQPVDEIYQEIHRLASAYRSGLHMNECISSNFA